MSGFSNKHAVEKFWARAKPLLKIYRVVYLHFFVCVKISNTIMAPHHHSPHPYLKDLIAWILFVCQNHKHKNRDDPMINTVMFYRMKTRITSMKWEPIWPSQIQVRSSKKAGRSARTLVLVSSLFTPLSSWVFDAAFEERSKRVAHSIYNLGGISYVFAYFNLLICSQKRWDYIVSEIIISNY